MFCVSLQRMILTSGREASPKQHTIVKSSTGRGERGGASPQKETKSRDVGVRAWLAYLQTQEAMAERCLHQEG